MDDRQILLCNSLASAVPSPPHPPAPPRTHPPLSSFVHAASELSKYSKVIFMQRVHPTVRLSLFPSEKEGRTESRSLLVRGCHHAARPDGPGGLQQRTRGPGQVRPTDNVEMPNASSTHDSDLIHLFTHRQLLQWVAKPIADDDDVTITQ